MYYGERRKKKSVRLQSTVSTVQVLYNSLAQLLLTTDKYKMLDYLVG